MHMYDLITKKKHGKALTDEELAFLIDGYVRGDIPDYQMAAMLMELKWTSTVRAAWGIKPPLR